MSKRAESYTPPLPPLSMRVDALVEIDTNIQKLRNGETHASPFPIAALGLAIDLPGPVLGRYSGLRHASLAAPLGLV